ncbi:MAG: hypothetical protein R2942_00450 [Ignavibacteria bacterium]
MLERVPENPTPGNLTKSRWILEDYLSIFPEIPMWVPETVDKMNLDFCKRRVYSEKGGSTNEDLSKNFDLNLANAIECLKNASLMKVNG